MAEIYDNIQAIRRELPEGVTLVAVTKYHDDAETQAVVDAGVLDLGENKVQDLLHKMDVIQGPVRWHLIGHLQTNKVKYLMGRVALIHSVDSVKLLEKIEQESIKHDVTTEVLLQFNLAEEATKSGFLAKDWRLPLEVAQSLTHTKVRGLMCMGPMTKNTAEIRKIFKQLKEIYDTIEREYHCESIQMQHLSMGMTDDYPIAVEEGATMVRIGRKIFRR